MNINVHDSDENLFQLKKDYFLWFMKNHKVTLNANQIRHKRNYIRINFYIYDIATEQWKELFFIQNRDRISWILEDVFASNWRKSELRTHNILILIKPISSGMINIFFVIWSYWTKSHSTRKWNDSSTKCQQLTETMQKEN